MDKTFTSTEIYVVFFTVTLNGRMEHHSAWVDAIDAIMAQEMIECQYCYDGVKVHNVKKA